MNDPEGALKQLLSHASDTSTQQEFERLVQEEKEYIESYIIRNRKHLSEKYALTLTPSRVEVVSSFYCENVMDIGNVIRKIKSYYDEIKKLELFFFKNHDINIVLEEDAIDLIIEQIMQYDMSLGDIFQKLSTDFQHGLKLIVEKTGKNRFFLSREALMDPETFLSKLIKNELNKNQLPS
ncbi:MAG: hypothetical protein JRI77_00485 [Deltaproteobacteria bacterium]|nr:hypothetical protein [Deltaproteobacteria bacterium]